MSYWNINTSIHTGPVWLAPAQAAIKCPLVKFWSWPELSPKLPPWLWSWQREKRSGWRIDTDETAETNITRHYNNNVTTCYEIWILYQLSWKNIFSLTRPGEDFVSRDDKIIICILMTFAWQVTIVTCHVTRETRVTCGLTSRDTDVTSPDCDCHKNTPHYCFNLTLWWGQILSGNWPILRATVAEN